MEILNYGGRNEIPSVYCDAEKGLVEIKGYSVTENPREDIYEPILMWLDQYSKIPKPETEVNIYLEYFNTSSSICLLDVFRIFQSIHNSTEDTSVVINWYYYEEDEDMSDVIDTFQDSLKVPFVKKIIEED